MLLITKGETKFWYLTLTEKVTISNPYFLFNLKNRVTEVETNVIISDVSNFKERYNKFKEEFSNKINELRKLESKEFKLSVFSLNNLEGYKKGEYNYIRSGYCLMTNIDNSNNRNKIYNELVINRISEDINIKEVIDNYVKELVK